MQPVAVHLTKPSEARVDMAVRIANQLQEIRSTLAEADEVFRGFRALLSKHPPADRRLIPFEWIPISDQ